MSDEDRTWIVLLRDLSAGVQVAGQDRVHTSLVLHAETGLILSTFVAATAQESLAGTFQAALTRTVAGLPPAAPARLVFTAQVADEVRRAAGTPALGSPKLIEADAIDEAEDIFDDLVGHLSGRAQLDQAPSSADWALLVAQTLAFVRAEPWLRWSDASRLALELIVEGSTEQYLAVVMGQAGVQHGLALYAMASLPDEQAMRRGQPPEGALLLFLDPEGESPPEFTGKARRYGWPVDEPLVPAWLASTQQGPRDLSDLDAQRLATALVAILAVDAQGPILARAKDTPLVGEVALSSGRVGRYEISRRTV